MRINVNGIDMYYEVHGSGRPLIMLHGNSEDHSIFNEATALLQNHFTVYTPDSRSHGYSSRTGELHYQDMADDMIAFMEQLDLKDVVFYGFSDGGIIGLLAAMKTDRMGMLITSGANLTPQGVKAPLRLFVKAAYAVQKNPKMKLMLAEPHITPQQLFEINIPAVIIAGENDVVLKKETVTIAESVTGAKLRIIPDEGHGSYIVHSSKIAEIIMEETGLSEPSKNSAITASQMKSLKAAQQGEADAVLMYERLASRVSDTGEKEAFLRLAGDEARHAEVFHKFTGKEIKANPAKAVLIPMLYKTIGKEKLYPLIAKGEYEAAQKYEHLIADFPEIETVMNDEVHHGDAVMDMLK